MVLIFFINLLKIECIFIIGNDFYLYDMKSVKYIFGNKYNLVFFYVENEGILYGFDF